MKSSPEERDHSDSCHGEVRVYLYIPSFVHVMYFHSVYNSKRYFKCRMSFLVRLSFFFFFVLSTILMVNYLKSSRTMILLHTRSICLRVGLGFWRITYVRENVGSKEDGSIPFFPFLETIDHTNSGEGDGVSLYLSLSGNTSKESETSTFQAHHLI